MKTNISRRTEFYTFPIRIIARGYAALRRIIPEKANDHEEADTKLIALVESSDVEHGRSVMVRSLSGDIDIIVLFLLHLTVFVFYVTTEQGKTEKS